MYCRMGGSRCQSEPCDLLEETSNLRTAVVCFQNSLRQSVSSSCLLCLTCRIITPPDWGPPHVLWFRAEKWELDKTKLVLTDTEQQQHTHTHTCHTHILGNPWPCCRGLLSPVAMVTGAETKCSSVTAAAHTHTLTHHPPTLTLTITAKVWLIKPGWRWQRTPHYGFNLMIHVWWRWWWHRSPMNDTV